MDYGYDSASRLVTYRDALGNTAEWSYDALDRKATTSYPDGTAEAYAYDPAGNVTSITGAAGSVIAQGFDAANRLVSREVTPGAGVEGPTVETYAYDGLDRLVRADSGDVVIEFGRRRVGAR